MPKKVFLDQKNCPICGCRTVVIFEKNANLKEYTTWENESTMRLLGIDTLICQLRFCVKCFHFHRYPLYEESYLYNEDGPKIRKEAFEKYNPTQKYGDQDVCFSQDLLLNISGTFSFLGQIFSGLSKTRFNLNKKNEMKILDWGGGDGYLCETIALLAQKVYKVPTKAFCYDYQDWVKETASPYYENISTDQIKKFAPFDIVLYSNILEHVRNLDSYLVRARNLLSDKGLLIVILPFEAFASLKPKSAYMSYHQHFFTLTSIRQFLARNEFHLNSISLRKTNYRGQIMWSFFCIAQTSKTKKMGLGPVSKLLDIYFFFRITFDIFLQKIMKKFSK